MAKRFSSEPTESILSVDCYGVNKPDHIFVEFSGEISGKRVFFTRFIITKTTLLKVIALKRGSTEPFHSKEETCIVSFENGLLTFKGRGKSITVTEKNLGMVVESICEVGENSI